MRCLLLFAVRSLCFIIAVTICFTEIDSPTYLSSPPSVSSAIVELLLMRLIYLNSIDRMIQVIRDDRAAYRAFYPGFSSTHLP
jgi:hypothetical protein